LSWFVICTIHGNIDERKSLDDATQLCLQHTHDDKNSGCRAGLFFIATKNEPQKKVDKQISLCVKKLLAKSNLQHRDFA